MNLISLAKKKKKETTKERHLEPLRTRDMQKGTKLIIHMFFGDRTRIMHFDCTKSG